MPTTSAPSSESRPVAERVEIIEVAVARGLAEKESLKQHRRWSHAPAGDTAGREAGDGKRPAVTAGREAGDDVIRFKQGGQLWQYPDEQKDIEYKVSYNRNIPSTSLLVFLTGTDGSPLTDAKSENPLSQWLQDHGCVIIEPDCFNCHAPKKKFKAPRGVNVCGR